MSPVRTPDRRRNTRVSFLLLFGVMASYSLLETARDALFLTRLPASKLPWAYLATAALVSLTALFPSRRPSRARTGAFLLAIAGAVMGLYLFEPLFGPYVFYVGVNLVGTLLLVSAWTLVGAQFTVGEARRAFAWIGAGELQLRVDTTFPLAQAAESHRYLEGRQSKGKVLLIP